MSLRQSERRLFLKGKKSARNASILYLLKNKKQKRRRKEKPQFFMNITWNSHWRPPFFFFCTADVFFFVYLFGFFVSTVVPKVIVTVRSEIEFVFTRLKYRNTFFF